MDVIYKPLINTYKQIATGGLAIIRKRIYKTNKVRYTNIKKNIKQNLHLDEMQSLHNRLKVELGRKNEIFYYS